MEPDNQAMAKLVLKIYIRVLLYVSNDLNNNKINTFLVYLNDLVSRNKAREEHDDDFKSIDQLYIESIANKNLLKYKKKCKKSSEEDGKDGDGKDGDGKDGDGKDGPGDGEDGDGKDGDGKDGPGDGEDGKAAEAVAVAKAAEVAEVAEVAEAAEAVAKAVEDGKDGDGKDGAGDGDGGPEAAAKAPGDGKDGAAEAAAKAAGDGKDGGPVGADGEPVGVDGGPVGADGGLVGAEEARDIDNAIQHILAKTKNIEYYHKTFSHSTFQALYKSLENIVKKGEPVLLAGIPQMDSINILKKYMDEFDRQIKKKTLAPEVAPEVAKAELAPEAAGAEQISQNSAKMHDAEKFFDDADEDLKTYINTLIEYAIKENEYKYIYGVGEKYPVLKPPPPANLSAESNKLATEYAQIFAKEKVAKRKNTPVLRNPVSAPIPPRKAKVAKAAEVAPAELETEVEAGPEVVALEPEVALAGPEDGDGDGAEAKAPEVVAAPKIGEADKVIADKVEAGPEVEAEPKIGEGLEAQKIALEKQIFTINDMLLLEKDAAKKNSLIRKKKLLTQRIKAIEQNLTMRDKLHEQTQKVQKVADTAKQFKKILRL
jgi:hypothetical protein